MKDLLLYDSSMDYHSPAMQQQFSILITSLRGTLANYHDGIAGFDEILRRDHDLLAPLSHNEECSSIAYHPDAF
jgi:hypothetical protein